MKSMTFLQLQEERKYYYINQKVIVLHIYENIHMVKIKILKTGKKIIIDMSAISIEPVYEKSISIRELGGKVR